jgi:predicted transcriptional regulator of viral defense system
MTLEDRVLVDLHRAALFAGRPGIAVPSADLEVANERIGNQRARDALKRLVRSDRVRSVRKDLAVLPDSLGRVTVELPELIEVVAPSRHLITGGSAVEHHGLTNQHSFSTFVLVPNQISGFSFRGEKASFVTTRPERIWGWEEQGPHFATPERAILDAVSSSRYGVPLSMAIDALHKAVEADPKFLSRLVEAARRYNSPIVARRLGVLVDRLFGGDAASPFRELRGKSRTPVRLRSSGMDDGVVDSTWNVLVNASTELQGVNG